MACRGGPEACPAISLQVADPRMPALQMDRVRRLRESRIGERARSDCSDIGQAFRFPENRRTAVGTKVKGHPKSAVGLACIKAGTTTRGDVLVTKECGNSVGAPGAPLAGEAVAERYFLGFALADDAKASAGTGCCSCHGNFSAWSGFRMGRPFGASDARQRKMAQGLMPAPYCLFLKCSCRPRRFPLAFRCSR